MFDLAGKVALVTGAGRGIGQAISFALARAGATIVATDVSTDAVAQTPRAIVAEGGTAEGLVMNVTDPATVQAAVEGALRTHGKIDILVNNAGITRDQLLMRLKRDDWDLVLQVNLTGAFTCTQAVLRPMLKQRSGRIISISSVVGQMGNAGQSNYAASKAGLIARDHGQRGRARADRHRHDARAARGGARRVGVQGAVEPLRHGRGRGIGRLLPGDGGGCVYHGAGPGRQRWDVHVGG
jgi:NADP-dependent 3-hydroxy acid dehydrogenase YdfG